jgi:hypothetical protein
VSTFDHNDFSRGQVLGLDMAYNGKQENKTLLLSENELRAKSLGHDFSSCMLINAVVS